jgi:hypothetical protein
MKFFLCVCSLSFRFNVSSQAIRFSKNLTSWDLYLRGLAVPAAFSSSSGPHKHDILRSGRNNGSSISNDERVDSSSSSSSSRSSSGGPAFIVEYLRSYANYGQVYTQLDRQDIFQLFIVRVGQVCPTCPLLLRSFLCPTAVVSLWEFLVFAIVCLCQAVVWVTAGRLEDQIEEFRSRTLHELKETDSDQEPNDVYQV